MPINVLVDVLMDEDKDGLPSRIRVISPPKFNSEHAEFLWGVVYEQRTPYTEPLQSRWGLKTKTRIELVYEGKSGKLYLVRPNSLEDIKPESQFNADEDIRYKKFPSIELYKAFFSLLNRDLKSKLS